MKLKTTFSHIALTTAALLANACALNKADDVGEYREALPQAAAVSVAGPGETSGNTQSVETGVGLLGTSGAAPAGAAKWYTFTRDIRASVNQVTREVLGSVWLVVHTQPTDVGADYATWGPYTDALEPVTYRFRVEKVGEHEYDYTLEGRPRASRSDDDYRAVLKGKGFGRLDSRHGDGSFTVDLDAAKALDPSRHANDSGTVIVTHDLPPTITRDLGALPRRIDVDLRPAGEEFAHIESVANTDSTGVISVDAHADLDASKTTAIEDVSVMSRFRADGAGRADITIAGGDLPAATPVVTASECWGTDFARVYYEDSIGFEATSGDAAACVYERQ